MDLPDWSHRHGDAGNTRTGARSAATSQRSRPKLERDLKGKGLEAPSTRTQPALEGPEFRAGGISIEDLLLQKARSLWSNGSRSVPSKSTDWMKGKDASMQSKIGKTEPIRVRSVAQTGNNQVATETQPCRGIVNFFS